MEHKFVPYVNIDENKVDIAFKELGIKAYFEYTGQRTGYSARLAEIREDARGDVTEKHVTLGKKIKERMAALSLDSDVDLDFLVEIACNHVPEFKMEDYFRRAKSEKRLSEERDFKNVFRRVVREYVTRSNRYDSPETCSSGANPNELYLEQQRKRERARIRSMFRPAAQVAMDSEKEE